jgi:hypothetical protein
MKKVLFPLLLSLASTMSLQAKTVRALFLGNSYTDVNNLPEIVKQLAISTGDTLIYSKYTPGGYRFSQHRTDQTSLNLIAQGDWDYVILQEQSQLPSFPDHQVITQVYPHARALDSLIHISNPCATTMFYMTWGRKNGDASNCPFVPEVCTYEGMDSMLQLRYTIMAEQNEAAIAPVAKVWRHLRNNNPNIELYTADESHPSAEGSYAAACTFFATMFQKNPALSTYNFGLNADVAQTIRAVSKFVVFDTLTHWYRFAEVPVADFSSTINGASVTFTNTSIFADEYEWDFGDGNQSNVENPSHTYAQTGIYTVKLTAKEADCSIRSIATQEVNIQSTAIRQKNKDVLTQLYPNPASKEITLESSGSITTARIIDILGRMQDASLETIGRNKYSLPLNRLSAGAYYLELIFGDGKKETIKFNIVK